MYGKIITKETGHILEKREHSIKKKWSERYFSSHIYFYCGKGLLSIFQCLVCLEYNKHLMVFHFKKHYAFDSSKTCINAYLAKNTKPSKIKDKSASKIILFSSIFIILILTAS